jgi:ATP-binding protein involved in chromosome partitioning
MSLSENNMKSVPKEVTDRTLQDQNVSESISAIKHKFIFISSQGGIGKTSVVGSLAITLSKRSLKVGLMDFNFQGPDIHKMLGIESTAVNGSNKRLIPMPYSDDLKVASIESMMQDRDETGVWGMPPKISDIRRFISSVDWGRLDFLLIDTPPGPSEELLVVIRGIPEAKIIIVTAPDKIPSGRAREMIRFFKKENITIFGWIENMRGFLCQHCGQRQELFSTGSGSRAVFLMDIPFLGRIPIDPYLSKGVDAEEPFMEKHPDSQAAEAYNLTAEKILKGTQWETPSGQS